VSHVCRVKLEVRDLAAIEAVFKELGCTLIRGKTTHTFWNRKQSPCEHAVKVPGTTYEIGLVQSGKGWTLAYDKYDGVIEGVCGRQLQHVNEAYVKRVTRKKLAHQGFRFREQRLDTGQLQFVAYK